MFGLICFEKSAPFIGLNILFILNLLLICRGFLTHEKNELVEPNVTKRNYQRILSNNEGSHNLYLHQENSTELQFDAFNLNSRNKNKKYDGMLYVGTDDYVNKYIDKDVITYIFGTGFDKNNKAILEEDLHDIQYDHGSHHEIVFRNSRGNNDQIIESIKNSKLNKISRAPKPFGYHDVHPLDGGRSPPVVVSVDSFFMDARPVTNKDFGKFVRATYYKTEAEQYGWSFVLSSFLSNPNLFEETNVDPHAKYWVVVEGAYWRAPEGPGSSYKYRMNHPVVHVSHRDAAEYCTWKSKRLPGEWEWEAAARSGMFHQHNRSLYSWGDDQSTRIAKKFVNLWGDGEFPWINYAEDGWRGTSPVDFYPPNIYGFFDLTGNVWEWMRGGKQKARIVRGGSYVDSLDGNFNHAATLGARATLHGTTATGNVGFRCARSPQGGTKYLYDSFGQRQNGQSGHVDKNRNTYHLTQDSSDNTINLVFPSPKSKASGYEKSKFYRPKTKFSNEL